MEPPGVGALQLEEELAGAGVEAADPHHGGPADEGQGLLGDGAGQGVTAGSLGCCPFHRTLVVVLEIRGSQGQMRGTLVGEWTHPL